MRERMVNLGLLNYVLSKYVLLAFFCIVQCTILLAIVFFALGFHGGPDRLLDAARRARDDVALRRRARPPALDARDVSREAAMALTPIALIPQVVLGGLMVPMTTNPHLKWLMYGIPRAGASRPPSPPSAWRS
jgi:heme A synthase